MPQFFQFEADFVESLRCIPMQVRFNLDTCGVKLKLQHWHQFTAAERQELTEMDCTTAADRQTYRDRLRQWVQNHTGTVPADLPLEATPAWMDEATIPDSVQAQSQASGIVITLRQWASLTPLHRFALIKLSRSNHENKNFLPALKEFQLV